MAVLTLTEKIKAAAEYCHLTTDPPSENFIAVKTKTFYKSYMYKEQKSKLSLDFSIQQGNKKWSNTFKL